MQGAIQVLGFTFTFTLDHSRGTLPPTQVYSTKNNHFMTK